MSLQFKPVTPQKRRAKVLLIGEPGVGKSHAAMTAPGVAVIDAEGSADWFADRFQFIAVPTKSYREVRELVKSVREGKVKCETLVIDSLTSIYNSLVNEATIERQTKSQSNPYPSDDLRPLDWGRIKRKFSSLLDELYHKLPCNVVCVGWIKAEYAKAGDTVDGKTVKPNDLIKVGEQFDGDRKTMYAFDFVIKVLGNNGKKTRAQVMKSRAGGLKNGQIVEDFSFATIAALMPDGEGEYVGMTDEEAQERDTGVVAEEYPGQRAERAVEPAADQEPQLSKAERRELFDKLKDVSMNLPEVRRMRAIKNGSFGRAFALDQIKSVTDAQNVLKELLREEEVYDAEKEATGRADLFTGADGKPLEEEVAL
jgi:hypothetical protein